MNEGAVEKVLNRPIARYRGELFEAWPSPLGPDHTRLANVFGAEATAGFAPTSESGSVPVLDVHKSELEELYKKTLSFTWRGKHFEVTKFVGDKLSASPVDADARWAKENGLSVIDQAWSVGAFAPAEVESLRETKHDLLTEWKERRRR